MPTDHCYLKPPRLTIAMSYNPDQMLAAEPLATNNKNSAYRRTVVTDGITITRMYERDNVRAAK